jgi:hypothetical protein
MKLADLDITAQRLVAIAVNAGCLIVNPMTGEIEGMYEPHAEELACMMVNAAARKGELGFVNPDTVLATIEAIITECHPEMEDRD